MYGCGLEHDLQQEKKARYSLIFEKVAKLNLKLHFPATCSTWTQLKFRKTCLVSKMIVILLGIPGEILLHYEWV